MTGQAATTPASKAGRDLPVAIGVGIALFVPFAVGLIWFPWLFILLVARFGSAD